MGYLLGWLNLPLILMVLLGQELIFEVFVKLPEDAESTLDLLTVLMYFLCRLLEGLVVGQEVGQLGNVFLILKA
jgi:hypothetical protein